MWEAGNQLVAGGGYYSTECWESSWMNAMIESNLSKPSEIYTKFIYRRERNGARFCRNLMQRWVQNQDGVKACFCGLKFENGFSFRLERYSTVFQAEILVISRCVEVLSAAVKKGTTLCICSASQVAVKVLEKPTRNSCSVVSAKASLAEQAGSEGNGRVDTLAKQDSIAEPIGMPFLEAIRCYCY